MLQGFSEKDGRSKDSLKHKITIMIVLHLLPVISVGRTILNMLFIVLISEIVSFQ